MIRTHNTRCRTQTTDCDIFGLTFSTFSPLAPLLRVNFDCIYIHPWVASLVTSAKNIHVMEEKSMHRRVPFFINPRRACARVTVVVQCVCVCVCVSVCSYSSCFSVRWNQQTTILTGLSVWSLPFVQKLWREKGNMQMSWSSPSAAFAQFRDQRNAAAT